MKTEKFIQNFSADIPIAGAVDLIDMIIPAKCTMVVLDFGNYCNTVAAWGTIYWDFYNDDLPLYPYNHIMDQIGFGTGRQAVQSVPINGGHRFRIRATNPTAGIVQMGISLEYELRYGEADDRE